MRTITKILSLLFTVSILFTACGSDKDHKSDYDFVGVCRQNVPLKGYKNNKVTTLPPAVSLNDLLSDYDFTPPITRGVLYPTDLTSIKITGLEEGIILRNVILNINGNKYEFGDITSQKTNLYTTETLNYFKNVFNSMISRKELKTEVTFTPNNDIDGINHNVNLEIVFKGQFFYRK